MDISQVILSRNSAEDFTNNFRKFSDAGAGIIHVRTKELSRTLTAIRSSIVLDDCICYEWNVVDGFRQFKLENMNDHLLTGDGESEPFTAFCRPMEEVRKQKKNPIPVVIDGMPTRTYFIYSGLHSFMDNNPFFAQLIAQYAAILPSSQVCVVIVTPDMPLPDSLQETVLSLPFDPPGMTELQHSLNKMLETATLSGIANDSITDEGIRRICATGAGMGIQEFELYSALAMTEAIFNGEGSVTTDLIIDGVSKGKTEVINKTDILELYPVEDIATVGGLENLKEWIAKRSHCYSDEAKKFGVQAPKGIVLVGLPGTGKTLIGKCAAAVLGVPLVRLDFSRVFNSLVGSSEARMRGALKAVESMSPLILLIDEIDKGLGGAGGSGDSGTSSRVLGTFLTWLNDCQYPVFCIVTANNITGLPPELFRKGRFDAIFSTTLPSPSERRQVLSIHLAKRGRNINDYDEKQVNEVIAASDRYVPAEIEAAVKDGLVDAFTEGNELSMAHIKKQIETMTPLSKSFATQIEAMQKWAEENAIPASKPEAMMLPENVIPSSRLSSRRRTKGE